MTKLQEGFPPKHLIAIADVRYVHRYNYCTELNGWILIVGATHIGGINYWAYQLADPDLGQPIGDVRRTSIDLWADRFADRPFTVDEPENVPPCEEWFRSLCAARWAGSKLRDKYMAYRERLSYSSSYEALLRIDAIAAQAVTL